MGREFNGTETHGPWPVMIGSGSDQAECVCDHTPNVTFVHALAESELIIVKKSL